MKDSTGSLSQRQPQSAIDVGRPRRVSPRRALAAFVAAGLLVGAVDPAQASDYALGGIPCDEMTPAHHGMHSKPSPGLLDKLNPRGPLFAALDAVAGGMEKLLFHKREAEASCDDACDAAMEAELWMPLEAPQIMPAPAPEMPAPRYPSVPQSAPWPSTKPAPIPQSRPAYDTVAPTPSPQPSQDRPLQSPGIEVKPLPEPGSQPAFPQPKPGPNSEPEPNPFENLTNPFEDDEVDWNAPSYQPVRPTRYYRPNRRSS
ncbi:MAG: hypothetical protein AAGA03_11290 [Planctomycetota bacterium]